MSSRQSELTCSRLPMCPYSDQSRPRLELDRMADWGQALEATGELTGLPLFDMQETTEEAT